MKNSMIRSPILLVASVLIALSSCGKQSFDVVQSQDNGSAGSTSIAPKVDILLAVDNSGSTYSVQAQLNASIRNFLTQLNAQDWDFRVTAIPLTGAPSIGQISASKYDANSANWVAPYPGAPHTSTIPASMYVSPANYQVSANTNSTDGYEPGLSNIGVALASSNAQYFLRPEAILAVVVISNGEDSSEAPMTTYPYLPPSAVSASLVNGIKNAKGSALASSVHLFPVVSKLGSSSCTALGGGRAWQATRYSNAGSQIGGHAVIDICSNQMSSVLTQIQTQVSAIKLNYVKRYVQLAAQPNESTIVVVKHASNGSAITVPKSVSGSAGWVYLGNVSEPMVSEPIMMDYRTGYMIQLIGDAYKLTGDESATVTYTPYGVTPSN